MRVDIVRELIQRMLDAASREGTLTESIALEIERGFRQEYAGDRYYVKQATHRECLNRETIVVQYIEGKDPKQIAKDNGIDRATVYRYLKR